MVNSEVCILQKRHVGSSNGRTLYCGKGYDRKCNAHSAHSACMIIYYLIFDEILTNTFAIEPMAEISINIYYGLKL